MTSSLSSSDATNHMFLAPSPGSRGKLNEEKLRLCSSSDGESPLGTPADAHSGSGSLDHGRSSGGISKVEFFEHVMTFTTAPASSVPDGRQCRVTAMSCYTEPDDSSSKSFGAII